MAIRHHILVRYSAWRVGVHDFTDYLILGDDVVIANKEVADSYIDIITSMGVKISLPKRVLPRPLQGVEFASKLINNQANLSPLPLGCLQTKTPLSMFTLWDALYSRGLELDADPALFHAPDFPKSYPLGQGPSGYEGLRTL